MALSVKHVFHSVKGDGPDSTLVKPSNWNAEHAIVTDDDGVILGRAPGSGSGPIVDGPITDFLTPEVLGEILPDIPTPCARFYRAASYASGGTNSAWLRVQLDGVEFNNDAGTFSGNVWTPGPGLWALSAGLTLGANGAALADQQYGVSIRRNTQVMASCHTFTKAGLAMSNTLSTIIPLAAGEQIDLAYIIAGLDPGNYAVFGGGHFTWLSGHRIRGG